MYLLLTASNTTLEPHNSQTSHTKSSKLDTQRSENYVKYKTSSVEPEDTVNQLLEKYILIVSDQDEVDALTFWKDHEQLFPGLALLAKKYLSVQASSAGVERMFSIAGHIFSLKRRRLGIKFFTQLLLLKLNEKFID